MIYPNHTIYGPYTNNENRRFVIIINNLDKTRKSLAYAKYLMELHLSRYLSSEETVDHIDRDKTNDVLSNLRVIDKSTHLKEDLKHVKPITVICIGENCNKELTRQAKDIRGNSKKGNAGPFCKSCASKYGDKLRKGLVDKLPPQSSVESEYYYLDKS
jgi:hypothetical protein